MRDARASQLRTILVAGLVAGALDLAAAFATGAAYGIAPLAILRFISSGVMGMSAFAAPAVLVAPLGVALHFLIMQGIAGCYVAAATQYEFLRTRPVRYGLPYGIVVYAVMNLVVVPLSAAPGTSTRTPGAVATGLVVHALCVGLPIALVTARRTR